ncbi:sulfatase family protein [Sunxiuqinia sp. A32]|uniref:sulfatase family protein n=1 Tax=Sunxiuqinia sp. A32 TaxID=3461496 RepID=UPI0040458668
MKLSKALISTQIVSTLILPLSSMSEPAVKDSHPNIVIFVADDLGACDIGAYGNMVVKTPNLDRLASKSILFTEAFASSPTCSPSRASIHTGQYPFRNGAHANHHGIKAGIKTLPSYLNELGYDVGFAGKLHIGPMSVYPFDLIHNTNVPEPGHEKDGVLWTDLNMGPVDEWLSNASDKKEPFMLVVNDHSPHVIWPENTEYDYSKIDIPSIHIDTKEARVSRSRYYTDISKMDKNVGRLLESLEKYNLDENTIVIFTADQGPQIAFGKWNLYDYGIRVPLIIRWPGVIEGGSNTHALVSLIDIVPTAIELAGGKAPKEIEEIDGRSLVPFLKGEKSSHRDVVYGSHTGDGKINQAPMRMIRTSRYKYILNLAPEVKYNTHINLAKDHDGGREYWSTWVDKSFTDQHAAAVLWRYHNRPKEELYDIQRDPSELHNLASDPYYEKIIEPFRVQMAEWRKQQGDTETGIFEDKRTQGEVIHYIFK